MRIPVITVIVVFIFSIVVDLYITADVKNSNKDKRWTAAYFVSAVVCWLFLAVTLCLPRRSTESGILMVMWMLYSYLTVYAAKFVYVICSAIGRLVEKFSRRRHRLHPSRWVGTGVAAAVFIMMWVGVGHTRRHIVVNKVDISSPTIPLPFNGYTIAQISDIHVGTWGNDTTFVAELVDSINSLHPDLIVFTGDIVNRQTSELKPFVNVLSRIRAKDGVFSVLGNHDYGDYVDWNSPAEREENNNQLAMYQKKMGWNLLNNERRFLIRDNDSIMLIGVENWGDPPFPTYGSLDKALSASQDSLYHQNDNRFKILLSHNPEHWNRVVSHETNIGLTLAGHTHAMQMMFDFGGWKWSPAKYRYEHWGGLFERLNDNGQATRLYVNIGAGEVGLPARLINAYPEISLLTLRHEGDSNIHSR